MRIFGSLIQRAQLRDGSGAKLRNKCHQGRRMATLASAIQVMRLFYGSPYFSALAPNGEKREGFASQLILRQARAPWAHLIRIPFLRVHIVGVVMARVEVIPPHTKGTDAMVTFARDPGRVC